MKTAKIRVTSFKLECPECGYDVSVNEESMFNECDFPDEDVRTAKCHSGHKVRIPTSKAILQKLWGKPKAKRSGS